MHSSGKVNYQARFDKLFHEFSDLERQTDAQDQFLRLILRRVFFAIDRAYPQLSQECMGIRAVLHQAGDNFLPLDRLRPLTEQLAERIREIEANEDAILPADADAPSNNASLSVRDALGMLLARIAFTEALQERESQLHQELQTDSTASDIVMVDRAAALINDMHSMDEREKNDLVDFLQQTTSKLVAIDQHTQMGLDQIQVDRDAQMQMNTSAKRQIDEWNVAVAASTNLNELKQTMQENLLQVGERFDQIRAREEQHLLKAEREIQTMRKHIAQLTQQTQTLQHQLKASAQHLLQDSITGLASETVLLKRLQSEMERAHNNQEPLCVAHWDIDGFRVITRRHGSTVGNKMLYIVGNNLRRMMRKNDAAARLRTDEFLLAVPGLDIDQAQPLLETMRKKINRISFLFKGETIHITVSCGLVQYLPGETLESLTSRAEKALAASKIQGGNHCTVA